MNRRSRWVALASASTILTLAAGFVYLRGGSTPVLLDTAVERFREQPTTTTTTQSSELPAPQPKAAASSRVESAQTPVRAAAERAVRSGRPLLPEGVYVYSTRGGDEVDVLGGSRHTYPDRTTVTVRHGGCGFVERWDALDERWDERESCRTAAGDKLRRTTAHHEFFGHGDTRTLYCNGFTFPAGAEPGDSWSMPCASENTNAVSKLTAVGYEDVDVGGVAVRTLHVHVETKITGEQEGTSIRDVWGSSETGVVVRERSTLTSYSTQPVFGRTRYHEAYENRLLSLEPRR